MANAYMPTLKTNGIENYNIIMPAIRCSVTNPYLTTSHFHASLRQKNTSLENDDSILIYKTINKTG